MENTCGGDSFLIKLQAEGLQLYFKIKTPTQVLSCEFSEISKNTLQNTSRIIFLKMKKGWSQR